METKIFKTKQLRYLLMAVLLVAVVVPAFGFSTTPKFYATKTSDSPSGAGMIYGYRGGGDYANGANGQNDRLTLPAAGDWKSADNTMTVFSGTIKMQDGSPTGNEEPDGYKVMDKKNSGGTETQMVLHMYFFAKPNSGYQFDGWYDKNNNALNGSRDHYPMPGVTSGVARVNKNDKVATFSPSTWDNGEGLTTASGYYAAGGFYYLRNPYTFHEFGDGVTVYAKFSVIPRTFTLAATGHAAVTYTATGYSGSISTSNVTTSELSSNISLNLTNPDPEQYIFEGWYWSDGKDGAQTLISESTSATFSWTDNSEIVAKMNTVWIWPKVTKIVNNVAEVTYNDVTTPYESWDDALTAAKAVSGATITLNKSVSDLSAVQTINKSMTINLNGNTLSGTVNNLFTITGSGVEVTITDNSSQGNGRIELVSSTVATTYAVSVQSGAKLTIAGGTVYSENGYSSGTARGVEAQSGTTLFVTGGHIEAQSLQNAYALINRGTATISGGDMYAHTTSGARSNAGTAVAFYNVGTTNTITGGTFRAYSHTYKAYGIQQNANNTLTINDATVRTETRGKWRNANDNGDDCITGNSYALFYSTGKIIVNGGKYYSINQGAGDKEVYNVVAPVNVANNNQVTLYGGVYLSHHNLAACAASGYVRTDLIYTDPNYTAGYRYAIVKNDTEPYVCQVLKSIDVFYYKTLEEAFAYVDANSSQQLTVVITAPNCTLSAGTYTIPSSTTLLVPFDVGGTVSMEKAPYYYNSNAARTRECYSKLTLESGATLKVYGKLNVNAQLHNKAGGSMVANILDSYGRIHMNEGSHIDLESGSLCSVWGFITGDGTITAKSGSLVREAFQFDFRGGTHISNTMSSAFPMCQYYVQNIEAPITFNYGATENLFTCCYASSADREGVASFIGSNGMFRLVSGSTLTRHYVGSEDRIYYDLYGNSSIQDISVDVEIAEMASKEYILPINNNMTLRVHSGTTTVYYDMSLLPDSKVIIDEGATVEIKQDFYIYDKSDWRADETGYTYQDSNDKTQKSYFAVSGDLNLVPFSPTKTFTRTSAGLTDAHIVVNGTLKTLSTDGKLYTTTNGADITSEGRGKVVLGVAAGGNTSFKQGVSTASKTQSIPVTAAQLHNSDDSYTSTSGAAATYQYCNGTWTKGGCSSTITYNPGANGTGSETSEIKAYGASYTLLGATFTREGYVQTGWSTTDGGDKAYALEASYEADADITLYPYWTALYTIKWKVDGEIVRTDQVPHGETPVYGEKDPTKDSDAQFDYSFTGWSPVVYPADKDQIYSGTFTTSTHYYTITWKNWDGEVLETDGEAQGMQYGATPHYDGATPTKAGDSHCSYTFKGWSNGTTTFGKDETLPSVAEDQIYTAQYDMSLVADAVGYTVSESETAVATVVNVSGKLNVPTGNSLTTTDLVLEASGNGSGDISGIERVSVTGNAYFDYTFDVDAWHWSAFGVPFEIDLTIAPVIKETATELVLGTDYDIVYYNTKNRAEKGVGKKNWEYVENHEHKLTPGIAYMIAFNRYLGHIGTVRFTKAAGAAVNYTGDVSVVSTGNGLDDNWYGIANPKMYHALLNAGATECQVHNGGEIGKDGYIPYIMEDKKFYVGKAAFVQVPPTQSVVEVEPAGDKVAIIPKAPRRAKAIEGTDRYDVKIAPMAEDMTDRLFLLTDEDKADEYVIVSDLAKVGVSPVCPQMWVERYGTKLCKNTTALIDNRADYPLGISVPMEGDYDIWVDELPNDGSMLYLTLDGQVVWNLSYGACTVELPKGTTTRYGLRIVAKAPTIATGIEEATIQNGDAVRKVLIDDKVFIIRNGEMYSIDGQLVK